MSLIPELNVIKKDWRSVDLTVALCYPNVSLDKYTRRNEVHEPLPWDHV